MSKDKVVSASGRSGQRAFEIESSTKSAVKAHQDVDVISGRTYAIAGWMMVEASKSGARVEVQWRTNKGKISIQSVGGPSRERTHGPRARHFSRLPRTPRAHD
jgi:hypothetical protein